jgi:hypothetical protein
LLIQPADSPAPSHCPQHPLWFFTCSDSIRRRRNLSKKINNITIIELDGKVLLRLYTGTNFVDAEISPLALGVLVADAAKVLCAVFQRSH